MKKSLSFVIPILVFVFLRILFVNNFWEYLENKASDVLFLIEGERAISDDVVIIEIGDDTFNSLNEQWPFPREYYARLIENLERAGAKQVVFDIEFTENSNPESDRILAETAAKYDNVIFAGKLIREIQANYVKQQLLPPIDEITKRGIKWGTVNISSDKDGFVRRYELFQTRGKKSKYSIGVMSVSSLDHSFDWEEGIANTNKEFSIRNKIIPKITYKSSLINYYGPPGTFKTFDFADVLDDSTFDVPFLDLNRFDDYLKDQSFKDKIVLIGITADEFHDTHHTPFSAETKQMMAGVEIHANFIEMVLNDDFLTGISYLTFVIFFFLITILLFVFNIHIKPTISIIVNLVLFAGNFALAFYLFDVKNHLFPILEFPALILIMYIIGLIFQYVKTANERKFIKTAFKHYLAPELVNDLIKDPKKLEYGGREKEISVLFSDIRSFTPYTESHSPHETVLILQEYLTAMVDVILKNKGIVDKFEGDAIMALFGTPVELDNHAFWACKAAFEMKQRLRELHKKWEKERKDTFDTGIGINSGMATVGNLGSEQIFDYTAIGDTINAGARLEALTKNYDTKHKIIISEETYKMAENRLIVKYLDDAKVKGKVQTIKIYELIGIKEEMEEESTKH